MKKYLLCISLLLAAALLCTAGCVAEEKTPQETNPQSAISGEWYNPQAMDIGDAVACIYYIFNDDNTGVVEFRSNGIAVKSINFRWMYVEESETVQYYLVAYTGLPRESGGQAQTSYLTIVAQDGVQYLVIFDGYSEGLTLIR
ncbi:MAG TPA: hypothetical protein O0X70_03345 [Methanocorpusculum sp.]|nr:hypothetical protein [Methanocorpusculum sp.]